MVTVRKRMKAQVEPYGSYDVIVCGGGPAGIAAAYSAALLGVKVVLLEQYGFLGGMATSGLPILTFHNMKCNQIIGGFAQLFVDYLKKLGGTPGHVPLQHGHMKTITPIDPEKVKFAAQELLLEKKVEVLHHCLAVEPVLKNNQVKGVFFESKGGRFYLEGKTVIDATGDADIVAKTGVEYELGDDSGNCQPMTMIFKIDGIDSQKAFQLTDEEIVVNPHPDPHSGFAPIFHITTQFKPWRQIIEKEGLFDGIADHRAWLMCLYQGEMFINTIKIIADSLDPAALSLAEISARREAHQIFKFLKQHIPGFENAHLSLTPVKIGIRESRRIIGDYSLNKEDILLGKKYQDTIAWCGYPIDVHKQDRIDSYFQYVEDQGEYGIPFRCLIPRELENILVAGRSISATHEAMASFRVMAPCMAIGQAAGVASALTVQEGSSSLRKIPVDVLQRILKDQGAIL